MVDITQLAQFLGLTTQLKEDYIWAFVDYPWALVLKGL
jgi:hypothetical protein